MFPSPHAQWEKKIFHECIDFRRIVLDMLSDFFLLNEVKGKHAAYYKMIHQIFLRRSDSYDGVYLYFELDLRREKWLKHMLAVNFAHQIVNFCSWIPLLFFEGHICNKLLGSVASHVRNKSAARLSRTWVQRIVLWKILRWIDLDSKVLLLMNCIKLT